MGIYLNPGNVSFKEAVHSPIYVDKTGLIACMNSVLGTKNKMLAVSRPRRFGKSMTVDMLVAYYSKGCESRALFEGLEIAASPEFEKHLNQYDVIRMDIQWMRSQALEKVRAGGCADIVGFIQREVLTELRQSYAEYMSDEDSLSMALAAIHAATGTQFIVIIDEWDCMFREDKENEALQKEYIGLLRGLLKGSVAEESIRLAYITGILPIKKYGTQSALNNFDEYTMINPGIMAEYMGFTEKEVMKLCEIFHMSFEETKRWYDGYCFLGTGHVYSPKSVVDAMTRQYFMSYWVGTETYESLKIPIEMNMDGLKDAVIRMLGGGRSEVDTVTFQNDMTTLRSKDDVLTLLVHLGYLAYDINLQEVFIPNEEIAGEFARAVKQTGWEEITDALNDSERLLHATLSKDEKAVAEAIDIVHMKTTASLVYNDENSLCCVIMLAYYSARKDYTMIRECPSGLGYADVVFLPRRHTDKPALVVELKWNKSAYGAIRQIKDRHYASAIEDYAGDILLVGINYEKKKKIHKCIIESFAKK